MEAMEWPPQYTIKRHPRAKHIKLSFSRSNGLEITLPIRCSVKHLPEVLEENKDWILVQQSKHHQSNPRIRPSEIHFLSVNKYWSIHYFQTDKRVRIRQFASDGIIMSGDIQDFGVCHDKLVAWMRKQAALLLTGYFRQLASELGLSFREVSVRSQATLWGSCSQDKSIRLNYKLLFLPETLMRHIMIHELCHTRYMNHSIKFWNLVAKYDGNWQENKAAMRSADKYIPAWITS